MQKRETPPALKGIGEKQTARGIPPAGRLLFPGSFDGKFLVRVFPKARLRRARDLPNP